jgi:hypothetical protein
MNGRDAAEDGWMVTLLERIQTFLRHSFICKLEKIERWFKGEEGLKAKKRKLKRKKKIKKKTKEKRNVIELKCS